jgi:hypothetical protein
MPLLFLGFLGFVGIGDGSSFVANEELLGFERELCVQQRGQGDEAAGGRGDEGESRTRCHQAKGLLPFRR